MKKSDACLVSAVASVLTLGTAVSTAAESTGPQTEMCFGYRLENSCGSHPNGCGGSALGPYRLRRAAGALPRSRSLDDGAGRNLRADLRRQSETARALTELAAVWIFANGRPGLPDGPIVSIETGHPSSPILNYPSA